VNRHRQITGKSMSPRPVLAARAARPAAHLRKLCRAAGGELEQIQLLGHAGGREANPAR